MNSLIRETMETVLHMHVSKPEPGKKVAKATIYKIRDMDFPIDLGEQVITGNEIMSIRNVFRRFGQPPCQCLLVLELTDGTEMHIYPVQKLEAAEGGGLEYDTHGEPAYDLAVEIRPKQ